MSSKNPTVAELVQAAQAQVPSMTEAVARVFLKVANVRSMGKLQNLLAPHAEKSAEEVEAEVQKMSQELGVQPTQTEVADAVSTAEAQETEAVETAEADVESDEVQTSTPQGETEMAATATSSKSKAKTKRTASGAPRKAAATKRHAERKGRAVRTIADAVPKGPRGFRIGPRWIESVVAGEGIAVSPVNFNKLLSHAEQMGVKVTSEDPKVVAAAIARKIEKQASE